MIAAAPRPSFTPPQRRRGTAPASWVEQRQRLEALCGRGEEATIADTVLPPPQSRLDPPRAYLEVDGRRMPLTSYELVAIRIGLFVVCDHPELTAPLMSRAKRHGPTPKSLRPIARAVIGWIMHGVFHDPHEGIAAWRVKHGADPEQIQVAVAAVGARKAAGAKEG